jgi:sugar-specific transcriptional regulator TrmB
MSTLLEEREAEITALFLKYHPESTAHEIASKTRIERVEVYYCLNVMLEREITKIIDSRPQRRALK